MKTQAQKRLQAIEKRITSIKKALLLIGEMRPGSLSRQTRGGKGAYYQLSYTHRMRGHTEYVRPELTAQVRRQLQTYRRFKRLVDEWVRLAIEHAKVQAAQAKEGQDR